MRTFPHRGFSLYMCYLFKIKILHSAYAPFRMTKYTRVHLNAYTITLNSYTVLLNAYTITLSAYTVILSKAKNLKK